MPRRTNNKPMHKPAHKPAPRPAAAPPPAAPHALQQGPSVGDSIKQGFSFGIGSAIAHRIFGKTETPAPTVTPVPQQDKMYELYNQCMEKNDKNVNCSDLLN